MSAQERSNVITRVEETRWGKRRLLAQLQVPRSTYSRWRARELQGKQDSSSAITRVPWNRLSSPEEAAVLAVARESPEWSSRQLLPYRGAKVPDMNVLPIRTMAIRVMTNPALVWEISRSTSIEGRVKLWAKLVNPVPQLTKTAVNSITPV